MTGSLPPIFTTLPDIRADRQRPGVVSGSEPVRGDDGRGADVQTFAKIIVYERLRQELVVAWPPIPGVPPNDHTLLASWQVCRQPMVPSCKPAQRLDHHPDVRAKSRAADGWHLTGPTPHSQPLTGLAGERKAENMVGPVPNGTVCAGWNGGCQTSGKIVRVMTFQSSLMWIGITGCTFRMSCVPLFGPVLNLVLFWNGKL